MLKSLNIRNFALIDSLEVEFSEGFSVITGETGTGKSVLLGAISMLLGQRSDAKMVRDGAGKCIIEGHFDLSSFPLHDFFEERDLEYDTDCIVRRELSSTGRGRAFINDTPVAVSDLKELGLLLIDIHSQHRNLLLGDKDFQLNILDVLSENNDALATYHAKYAEYIEKQKVLSRLKAALEKGRNDEDWLRFQLEEIDAAGFRDGEQEELEQEMKELSHSEVIQTALYTAASVIDGEEEHNMLRSLREAVNSLSRVSGHYAAAEEFSERLENCYIELKDCCKEIYDRIENVKFTPERLETVSTRLSSIYDLQKKHRVSSLTELLAVADDFRKRLECITGSDEEIMKLEKECEELSNLLSETASEITRLRKTAAEVLQKEITDILVTLGMPLIRFNVEFSSTNGFTPTGCDAVAFMFSANSISPLQPLSEVASGGEMARVMLALKSLVAGRINQPTLIFDEIDTGISGVLAERMGRLMLKMGASNRQVISITHLPQVAALGQTHYKVYKEERELGTCTNIIKLESEERVKEIAQMMSGEMLNEAALDNARQLLSQS